MRVLRARCIVSLSEAPDAVQVHPIMLPVTGSGCRVQGAGCRVQGSGFRVQGSGFMHAASSRYPRPLTPSRSISHIFVHPTRIVPSHTHLSIPPRFHPTSHLNIFRNGHYGLSLWGLSGKYWIFPHLRVLRACYLRSLSEAPDAVQVHLTQICPSPTHLSTPHTFFHPTQISSHQPFKLFCSKTGYYG